MIFNICHRFPSSKSIRKKWIKTMMWEGFEPKKHFICSEHFRKSQLNFTIPSRIVLRRNAIPTIKVIIDRQPEFEIHPVINSSTMTTSENDNQQRSDTYNLHDPTFNHESPIVKNQSENDTFSNKVQQSSLANTLKPSTSVKSNTGKRKYVFGVWRPANKVMRTYSRDKINKIENIEEQTNKIINYPTDSNKITSHFQSKIKSNSIKTFKDLISDLLLQNFLSKTDVLRLFGYEGPNKLFLQCEIFQSESSTHYIMKFVANLQFYWPHVYDYLVKKYQNCFSIQSIALWYRSIDAEPGFTKECLHVLKDAANTAMLNNETVYVNIVFYEMTIQVQLDQTTKKVYGFVDMGDIADGKIKASRIILIMIVCLNRNWKIPLGYFPVAVLTGEQKKQILNMVFKLVNDCDVEIVGVTIDEKLTNLDALNILGCNLDSNKNLKTTFNINVEGTTKPALMFLDPIHMIKLVRNAFIYFNIITDDQNKAIKWEYLSILNNLVQTEDISKFQNILSSVHINFIHIKQKIALATQHFSNFIADALEFCLIELELSEFEGCEATIRFIRIVNKIIDILTSRNLNNLNASTAICESNANIVFKFAQEAILYLSKLKTSNELIIESDHHKTGFIGLVAGLQNMKLLYEKFIKTKRLKYLSMYKLNQDHAELFHYSIRNGLRLNRNPTVFQFKTIYKKLIKHCQTTRTGICDKFPLEEISILNIDYKNSENLINDSCMRARVLGSQPECNKSTNQKFNLPKIILDCDHLFGPLIPNEYKMYALKHIACAITKYMIENIKCIDCFSTIEDSPDNSSSFSNKKNDFNYLSMGIFKLCCITEKYLKVTVSENSEILFLRNKRSTIRIRVQREIIDIPPFLSSTCCRLHYYLLTKAIIEKYLSVRICCLEIMKFKKSFSTKTLFYNKLNEFKKTLI